MNDETSLPEECAPYEIKDSNRLVEEFMLLANNSVAEHIYKAFPTLALLRRHPKPLQRKMDEVVRQCQKLGIKLAASTFVSHPDSLVLLPLVPSFRTLTTPLRPNRTGRRSCMTPWPG